MHACCHHCTLLHGAAALTAAAALWFTVHWFAEALAPYTPAAANRTSTSVSNDCKGRAMQAAVTQSMQKGSFIGCMC